MAAMLGNLAGVLPAAAAAVFSDGPVATSRLAHAEPTTGPPTDDPNRNRGRDSNSRSQAVAEAVQGALVVVPGLPRSTKVGGRFGHAKVRERGGMLVLSRAATARRK